MPVATFLIFYPYKFFSVRACSLPYPAAPAYSTPRLSPIYSPPSTLSLIPRRFNPPLTLTAYSMLVALETTSPLPLTLFWIRSDPRRSVPHISRRVSCSVHSDIGSYSLRAGFYVLCRIVRPDQQGMYDRKGTHNLHLCSGIHFDLRRASFIVHSTKYRQG
jgi:hypothetical protein